MRRQEAHQQDSTCITPSHDTVTGTPATTALLDLVIALQHCTTNDNELVATFASLNNSARVWLGDPFAGASIAVSLAADAIPPS
jgi:hypothetical protein